MAKILKMTYKTENDKKFEQIVPFPKSDLDREKVHAVMTQVVSAGVFADKLGNAVEDIVGAKVVTTEVVELI